MEGREDQRFECAVGRNLVAKLIPRELQLDIIGTLGLDWWKIERIVAVASLRVPMSAVVQQLIHPHRRVRPCDFREHPRALQNHRTPPIRGIPHDAARPADRQGRKHPKDEVVATAAPPPDRYSPSDAGRVHSPLSRLRVHESPDDEILRLDDKMMRGRTAGRDLQSIRVGKSKRLCASSIEEE